MQELYQSSCALSPVPPYYGHSQDPPQTADLSKQGRNEVTLYRTTLNSLTFLTSLFLTILTILKIFSPPLSAFPLLLSLLLFSPSPLPVPFLLGVRLEADQATPNCTSHSQSCCGKKPYKPPTEKPSSHRALRYLDSRDIVGFLSPISQATRSKEDLRRLPMAHVPPL